MPLRSLLLVFVIITLFQCLGCAEKRMRTQKEAEKIAENALIQYAQKENIPLSEFNPSQLRRAHYNKDVEVWVFYYDSETNPRHRVDILIDQFGNAELHREIERN